MSTFILLLVPECLYGIRVVLASVHWKIPLDIIFYFIVETLNYANIIMSMIIYYLLKKS